MPTEAELEYACRAGTTTQYSFGDDESQLGQYAWYDKNALEIGERYAHEVGRKRPNPWGLYDMHGNVWEWCSDWYAGDYYANSPTQDPPGPGSGPIAPQVRLERGSFFTESSRVLRGGAWHADAIYSRCTYRAYFPAVLRLNSIGFRVVAE